jgi:hypothetical protein
VESGPLDIDNNYPPITLSGENPKTKSKATLKLTSQGSLITVKSGGTVTLKDITLEGLMTNNGTTNITGTDINGSHVTINIDLNGNDPQNNNTALVTVSKGHLIMETGAKITGNYNSEVSRVHGGGVYINGGFENNNYTARFTMKDGTISGNHNNDQSLGGGVVVESGDFTMEGGTIEDNTAGSGGGVTLNGGNFYMEGGSINNNMSFASGSLENIEVYGGAVYVLGKFEMTGGTISGNITAPMKGLGRDPSGAGVVIIDGFPGYPSEFIKTGGTIYGKDAAEPEKQNTIYKSEQVVGDIVKNHGYAVYVRSIDDDCKEIPGLTRMRNETADPDVELYYKLYNLADNKYEAITNGTDNNWSKP